MAHICAQHLAGPFVAAESNRLVRAIRKLLTVFAFSGTLQVASTLACMRWVCILGSDLLTFPHDRNVFSIVCGLVFYLLDLIFV